MQEEINLIISQNEGLKKQNEELQKEIKILRGWREIAHKKIKSLSYDARTSREGYERLYHGINQILNPEMYRKDDE